MPEKSIYDVAFGAGAETGKYGAELLKTEDIWERMAHKEKATDWKIEQETSMANVAMDTLGLASEVYGGFAAKKEFEGVLADTSARAGEAAYTKGAKDTDVKWSELDPSKQAEWTAKFTPEKKEQKWYNALFGEEEEYKFGESDYFKKSDITAAQGLSEVKSLEGLLDLGDLSKKSMAEDDAGLSKKETDKKTPKKTDQNVVSITSGEPDWGDDPEKEDIPGLNIDPRMNKNPRKFY